MLRPVENESTASLQSCGPDETLDAIRGGEVRLFQRRSGYRFNVDSVLLSFFAMAGREAERSIDVLDGGSGCGVIALLIKRQRPVWRVRGVELQPLLADLARRSARLNGLDVEFFQDDLREAALSWAGAFDLVVSNPPFFDVGAGQPCDEPERHLARQDVMLRPHELALAARRLLRDHGSFCAVYPVERLAVLWRAMEGERLVPTRLRFVHPREGAPAGHVLVEARPGSKRPMTVEPPLFVHAAQGGYSPEVAGWLAGSGEGGAC